MKGRFYLALTLLFAAAAVAAQFWPPDRTPPSVTINPVPGLYREPVRITFDTESGAKVFFSTGNVDDVPYAVPLVLKRDSKIKYYALDRFGNRSRENEASYQVRLDTVPPVTVASPRGGKFQHPVSVRLQTEEGARIFYTLDGSDPTEKSTPYVEPIILRNDSALKFFALDPAGNWEEVKTEEYHITLDSTKPVTLAEPSGGLFRSPVTVTLSAEKGSTIYYSIDGSRPSIKSDKYSTPVTFVRSGVLRFFAVDQAGNREDVREESYLIDADPPSVTASPNGGTFAQPVTVELKSSERGRIYYEIGGQEPGLSSTEFHGPFTLSKSEVVSFFARDLAGNMSPVQTVEYIIDTAPPEVVLRPPGGHYSGRIRVKIEPSEPSDIYYTLDGSTPTEKSALYSGPVSIENNAVLTCMAVDRVGNRSVPEVQHYILDNAAPMTEADPPGGVYPGEVTVSLTAEPGNVIRYTLDGNDPTQASPLYTEPIRLEKDTVLKFFSTDESGNREEVRVEKYTIKERDTSPPVTIPFPGPGEYNPPVSLQLRPSEDATVYFTLDGSEPSERSNVYRMPLSIKKDTTVKFLAVDRAGNREKSRTAVYRIRNGIWADHTKGVFIHPSIIDGDYLWVGEEEGLSRVNIVNKSRKRFTTDDGLISNSVRALAIDGLGFVWIGTDKGVSRFDGKEEWVNYDDGDGLPSDTINCIAVDLKDNLWFGTNHGLAQFDGKDFKVLTTRDGLPHNNITSIAIDANGTFWIGTSGGLLKLAGKERTVFKTSDGLSANLVTAIAVDGMWNVWVGTHGHGVGRYDGRSWERYGEEQGLPAATIDVIVVDLAGNKWFGTPDGVYKYNGSVFKRITDEIYR